ncbi:MAG: hypothetical protein ACLUGY_20065 [Phocaeicola massiliensis]
MVHEKMVIPEERMTAAVGQCAILVMSVNIISVPYNAAIIAHERWVHCLSVVGSNVKTANRIHALHITVDKLILYEILLLVSVNYQLLFVAVTNI